MTQTNGLKGNEARVMYALARNPGGRIKDIASFLDMRPSTVSSIKDRLLIKKLMRWVRIPCVQRLGAELMGLVYANFNPMKPASERAEFTKKVIEVYDELFLSIGESNLGFSMNFSKDYTTMERINEIRVETFSKQRFLERSHPTSVIFPFSLSSVYRFFDCADFLDHTYRLGYGGSGPDHGLESANAAMFSDVRREILSDSEKRIFTALIGRPGSSDSEIASELGFSSRYISIVRKSFEERKLYKTVLLPNFKALNMDLVHMLHGQFDPLHVPTEEDIASLFLKYPNIIMFVRSKYNFACMSIFDEYSEFKVFKGDVIKGLREGKHMAGLPDSFSYSYDNLVVMKDILFAPMVKKLLDQ